MSRRPSGPRVLYMVYWGAAEPLGQSLILPAVRALSELGASMTLITFEKPSDLNRTGELARIRELLSNHGIRWIPLRYHKRPKVPATAFDCIQGCARGLLARYGAKADIIHARTFLGGLMGRALAATLGTRLIYHNEGFYPDEQVDGGVWTLNSMPHRIAKWLEREMYETADGIITMSNRGKEVIENISGVRRRKTPVIVVPSCVDLLQFRWGDMKPPLPRETIRLVYAGSVGGRYLLDRIGRFVEVGSQQVGAVRLQVLSHADPRMVESMLGEGGLSRDSWTLKGVPHAAMPGELARHHAGLFFLTLGLSEHGCSPTKIGEYWAVGMPVITTPNVSDTDEIIRRERIGVIVSEHSDEAYRRAWQELLELLRDPELSRRCRRSAERHYALGSGCERQFSLYRDILSRASQS